MGVATSSGGGGSSGSSTLDPDSLGIQSLRIDSLGAAAGRVACRPTFDAEARVCELGATTSW
jgi:hypothetical protein